MKIKTKRISLLILAFVAIVMSANAECWPYAELSSDGTTLTFKYGEMPSSGNCWHVGNTGIPVWDCSPTNEHPYSENITTVVFEPSFKEARPKSCHRWFNGMAKLTKIQGLCYLNTSEVTKMSSMFNGCQNLETIDVSGFNTSKVTDMYRMFRLCTKLTKIHGLCSLNTSEVTDMSNMFYCCQNLETIDVSGFNTSKVTEMGAMFAGCAKVKVLDVRSFDTSNVESMVSMFSNCYSLTTIYCNDSWSCSSENGRRMFSSDADTPLEGAVAYEYLQSKIDVSMANPETGYFTYKYDYDIWINGTQVTPGNMGDLSVIDGVSGMVKYSPADNNTLTLYNAQISASGNTPAIRCEQGINIKLVGTSNVTTSNGASIITKDVSVTGGGTLVAKSVNAEGMSVVNGDMYVGDNCVMEVSGKNGIMTEGKCLMKICDGAQLTVQGNSGKGISNSSEALQLFVAGGNSKLRAKGSDYTLYGLSELILDYSLCIQEPEGVRMGYGTLLNVDGSFCNEWVEIGLKKYDFEVGGIPVTIMNKDNITGSNIKQGTASYDDETKTLTLTDCVISMDAVSGTVGIKSNMDSLAIHLVGNNSIGMVETGIECSRNLTIAGPGKLDMMLCGTGIAMTDKTYKAELAICDDAKLSMVLVGTGIVGTYVDKPGHVFFQKNLRISGGNSDVDIIASQSAVSDMNVLTLNDGIALTAPVGAKYSYGAVRDKDGNLVQNKKVRFSHLGDVNNDGAVTMADANAVVNYFLATDKPSNFDVDNANVNGDGDDDGKPSITMADANAIVNMFLGQ